MDGCEGKKKSGGGGDKSCAWPGQLTIRIDPSLQSNHHHRQQQQAGPGCGRCSRQQVDNITQPLSRISTEEKLLRLPAYANLKMFIPQFES